MPLEAICLQHFMAFEDSGWLELRPITLLYGRNSSGKSTVLRALRLLRQSLDLPPGGPHLALTRARGLDLGPFEAIVHRPHSEERPLVLFHFRCGPLPPSLSEAAAGWVEARGGSRPVLPTHTYLSLGYGWDGNDARMELFHLRLALPRDDGVVGPGTALLVADRLDEVTAADLGFTWLIADDFYTSESEVPFPDLELQMPGGCLPVIGGAVGDIDGAGQPISRLVGYATAEIKSFLNSIEYIGPIRPEPRRAYLLSTEAEEQSLHTEAYGRFLRERLDSESFRQIDQWLTDMDMAAGIRRPMLLYDDKVLALSKLELNESEVGLGVGLNEMGYGVSQVLPILVTCAAARPGTVVVVEQPELHLHPRAQAHLGDVFLIGSQGGVGFLIETHSEHLILRIQRRIREKRAFPEQILTYYVTRGEGRSFLHRLHLDDDGDFTESWPEGFFPEKFDELFALADETTAVKPAH